MPAAGKAALARDFAAKITEHLNDTLDMTMEWGVQVFGEGRIIWTAEYPTLAAFERDLAKVTDDDRSQELSQEADGIFVDGSLKDTLVGVM
jgi:hypothetical protein